MSSKKPPQRKYGAAFGQAITEICSTYGFASLNALIDAAGLTSNRAGWFRRFNGERQTDQTDLNDLFRGLEEGGIPLAQEDKERLSQAVGIRILKQADISDRIAQLRSALDPDRDDLLKSRQAEFVEGTRQHEVGDVLEKIAHLKATGGYLLITGRAGEGKTSLVAHLIQAPFFTGGSGISYYSFYP